MDYSIAEHEIIRNMPFTKGARYIKYTFFFFLLSIIIN